MKNFKTNLSVSILVFLCSTTFLSAQVEKGLKLIDKNKFTQAEIAIKKDVDDKKYGAMAAYAMGKLYATIGYPAYNLDSAYLLMLKAEKSFKKMDYKLRNKIRKKFNTSTIKKQKKVIAQKAFIQAEETESLQAWNHFINFYKKPGRKYEKKAAIARNDIAFNNANKNNKWGDYANLLEKYGASMKRYSPGLFKKAERELLNTYITEKSWAAYDDFAKKFTNNSYVKKNVIEELDSLVSLKKPTLLFDFIKRYKNTVFVPKGVHRLTEELSEYGSFIDCKKFLEEHKNAPNSGDVWKRLYFSYAAKAKPTIESLNSFQERFPGYPFPEQLKRNRLKIADAMYKKLMETESLLGLKNFLTQFPTYDKVNTAWTKYYELYKENRPTLDDLTNFEKHHPTFPFTERIKKDKAERLNQKADNIIANGNIASLKSFIEDYPTHDKTSNIWKKWYSIVKQNATAYKTLADFQKRHPEYPDMAQIDTDITLFKKNKEKADFEKLTATSSINNYYEFLDKYPSSAYTSKIETELSVRVTDNEGTKRDMKRFLKKFKHGKYYNKVAKKLYREIAKNGTRDDIADFIEKHPNLISQKQVEKDFKNIKVKGYEVSTYSSSKAATFKLYINQNAPNDGAYRALRKMIKADLADKNYKKAAQTMETFKSNFNGNKKYDKLLKILTENEQKVEAISISSLVNTTASAEFSAIISADGNSLYFCKSRIYNYDENIYVSQKKNGIWQEATAVDRFAQANAHESPQALSTDGNALVLFKNGKLYTSEKEADGWSTPEALPGTINIGRWQADAKITADNNAIIFASGTSSSSSDIDIYISLKDKNGKWEKAFSLGNTINTSKADRAPFLHPDMKTLYFSSEGHIGLGKSDIFISKRLDDSWTNWSEPVNMGKSLNSTGIEFEFKVTTDGKKAYFSKENRANSSNFDIYISDLPQVYQPEQVTTITGAVLDIDGTPIGTEIVWEDLETGETIQITSSDPTTGQFFATLPPQEGKIGYTIKHKAYIPLSGNIDVSKENAKNIVLEAPMIIVSIEEMKTTGFKFELNNLFFETAKFDIKSTSYPELNRLADWMKEYKLVIEILGHTDNVGNAEANQLLSENRANAVRKYLIKKGCTSANISIKGFGETAPVKTNDTITGRAKNRRVEIRLRE